VDIYEIRVKFLILVPVVPYRYPLGLFEKKQNCPCLVDFFFTFCRPTMPFPKRTTQYTVQKNVNVPYLINKYQISSGSKSALKSSHGKKHGKKFFCELASVFESLVGET
jgi:hypothetical protein